MEARLARAGITEEELKLADERDPKKFRLIEIDGCVLLREEYERNRELPIEAFQDKTGYESFVNHEHFVFDGSDEAMRGCVESVLALIAALGRSGGARLFSVLLSIGSDCSLRFHTVRPNEKYLADDLETYRSEAVCAWLVGDAEIAG